MIVSPHTACLEVNPAQIEKKNVHSEITYDKNSIFDLSVKDNGRRSCIEIICSDLLSGSKC